jgi:hypothetical protein
MLNPALFKMNPTLPHNAAEIAAAAAAAATSAIDSSRLSALGSTAAAEIATLAAQAALSSLSGMVPSFSVATTASGAASAASSTATSLPAEASLSNSKNAGLVYAAQAFRNLQSGSRHQNDKLCLAMCGRYVCKSMIEKNRYRCPYFHPAFARVLSPKKVFGQQHVCIDFIWSDKCGQGGKVTFSSCSNDMYFINTEFDA